MRPAVCIALVVVGISAVVCGAASLTGGWLGTPPWWERASEPMSIDLGGESVAFSRSHGPPTIAQVRASYDGHPNVTPIDGREWISAGVVTAGMVLFTIGAWPRRLRERVL